IASTLRVLTISLSLVHSWRCILLFYVCYCLLRHLHSFLHDALPIWVRPGPRPVGRPRGSPGAGAERGPGRRAPRRGRPPGRRGRDRKSTRLNSSHVSISYDVFCLKEKNCIVIHLTARTPKSVNSAT